MADQFWKSKNENMADQSTNPIDDDNKPDATLGELKKEIWDQRI